MAGKQQNGNHPDAPNGKKNGNGINGKENGNGAKKNGNEAKKEQNNGNGKTNGRSNNEKKMNGANGNGHPRREGPVRLNGANGEQRGQEINGKQTTKPRIIRKILLLAPGETMEQVSPAWFQLCVGEDGSYWQNNINFPAALHPRNEATDGSYSNDPPLTNVGKAEGQLTGRAIQRNYIKVTQIFSAPDYASVETSHEVLLQLIDGEECNGDEAMLRINVEPALAKEPIDATKAALVWLPAERFAEHGMPTVDNNYEPLDAGELNAEDDVWGDQRIQQFVTTVIEAGTEGSILIVAPPSTLMAILRRLRGGWPTHRGDETRRWPSSGIVGLELKNGNGWSVIPNVIPPLTLRRLTFDNSVQLDATDSDVFA